MIKLDSDIESSASEVSAKRGRGAIRRREKNGIRTAPAEKRKRMCWFFAKLLFSQSFM